MKSFNVPLGKTMPRRMTAAEVDAFGRRTGWIDDIAAINPTTSVVDMLELPWWDGVTLLTVRDLTWPDQTMVGAWMLDDHLHRLDGTSTSIHAMNAQRAPKIDTDTVLPYLGFFTFFVQGVEGSFKILETVDDLIFPVGARVDEIERLLRPATLLDKRTDGFHCEAIVFYSDAIFFANFIVRQSGLVEMIEDEPLLQNIGSRFCMSLTIKGRNLRKLSPVD